LGLDLIIPFIACITLFICGLVVCFKVVNDEYGLLSTEFNVKAFPTTFIYDKNKNLKFTEVGYTSTFGLKLRLWWSSF
jgi:predicted secreted protein